ncbi:MAG TPA: hypothetical protein VGW11_00910 [Solirubrobacteraceae bacterium]|nr:hypothetical protein [Solirubrobacteraceae bacterium]
MRGHRLLHFSMADLHHHSGQPAAEVSVLELDPDWDGSDPLYAHRQPGRERREPSLPAP